MDVSQVASLPVTPSGRSNMEAGVAYAQTPQVAPRLASPKIDTSSGASGTAGAAITINTSAEPSADHLSQAIKQVNDSFNLKDQNLYASFEKDKITGINVVKITDIKTKEIITQMPPKEIVKFAQALEEAQGGRGQLLHDKA